MIVVKFGGSSVANVTKIRRAASLIAEKYLSAGENVVVVVSAMFGVTDTLNNYLLEMTSKKKVENDVVLSAGEQITTALLAIALNDLGYRAQSFLGWQIPIITDENFCNARIIDISTGNILNCFDKNIVPIVAGFQGLTEKARVTTLGRGGSDTTAVAIATALRASQCDIYTDVSGIYTADPKKVILAQKIDKISFEEAFELSFCGAKVLNSRSVEIAMKHNMKVKVLSTFNVGSGTDIVEGNMEELSITGIANKSNIVRFNIKMQKKRNETIKIMSEIAKTKVPIEWLNCSEVEQSLSFFVDFSSATEIKDVCQILKENKRIINFTLDYDVALVSIIGIGIGSNNEAIYTILNILERNDIEVFYFVVTPLSIRVLIKQQDVSIASASIHAEFGLDLSN
ncbi:MAG: aspartate kinase [Holosporales bacterium]|jgi:aspartate kinase|nr:aspartate kinase [Holosporales bacterium]